MENSVREELIERYFDLLDEEEFELVSEIFTRDVEYNYYPSEDKSITGRESVEEFFREEREASDSDHIADRYIHDSNATAVEGHDTYDLPDGESHYGEWVDIVEFDETAGLISSITVYRW